MRQSTRLSCRLVTNRVHGDLSGGGGGVGHSAVFDSLLHLKKGYYDQVVFYIFEGYTYCLRIYVSKA